MTVEYINPQNNWKYVVDSARTTIGKEAINKDNPSTSFKKQILLAEHSPIRQLIFRFKWSNLLSWVSVHFVRHKTGIEHFVRSQRTDRTGVNRDELKQSEKVNHEIMANAQAMITISRKRLCTKASIETREAWKEVLESIRDSEPELFSVCVRECIYRGFCPEFDGCGYDTTEVFKDKLAHYRKVT